MFDPRKCKFSAEELKPQPMIKKARKVFIPEDLKVIWSWFWRNVFESPRSLISRLSVYISKAIIISHTQGQRNSFRCFCKVFSYKQNIGLLMVVHISYSEVKFNTLRRKVHSWFSKQQLTNQDHHRFSGCGETRSSSTESTSNFQFTTWTRKCSEIRKGTMENTVW